MGSAAFQNNGMGNHITGSQLQPFVIPVHEAFLVAVQQICPLAADSLRDQETLSGVVVVECCGVKLDQMQVPNLRTVFIGKCNAVAGSDLGIGGEPVDPSDAAGSQYHKVATVHSAGAALHHIDGKAGVGLLHARHHGVFQNGHIGQGLYLFAQLVQDLRTGGIFVVENAVAAVTALQCPVEFAVRCPVKVHAEIQNRLNLVCGMCGQNVHRFRIVGKPAGNHGVMLVQFNGILRRLVHTGDPALSQCRVAQGQFLFAQQQDPAV